MNTNKPAASGKEIYFVLFLFHLLAGLMLSLQLQAQSLPSGFTRVQVASGLSKPTAMAFAPDGRIFVAQQGGELRIIKNGSLLATPFLKLTVNSAGEQGLLGIALDPNFASNQYVYLYYSLADGSRNRISRFKGNGDVVVSGSEMVLLNLDPVKGYYHNGGSMHFGLDGKLYVAIGENSYPAHAQNLDTYHGKLLRINPDGSVPAGNPFTGSAQRSRVWAYGLRNPFTFDIQPGTGKIFVNDVGEKSWEEINDATTGGKNFGWPTAEGNSSNAAFTNPFFAYPYEPGSKDGVGCAITGGTFFNPPTTNYPAEYYGRYFYQDYCNGWINMLSISGSTASRLPFATGLGGNAISIKVGSDGNLYYFERSNSALYKIIYTNNTAPAIVKQPASVTVPAGQPASFSVTATGTAPLKYQWQKNKANISGATAATYSISSTTSSHAGAYRVIVSNGTGSVTSQEAQLTVTALNNSPDAQILTPLANTYYRGGDTIRFSGSATDTEDGTLPASAFSWSVDFHHDSHKHDGPPIATGVKSGYFVIPSTGEVSDNVWYRLLLTVKDSGGLTKTVYRDILPHKTTISLATLPAGLQVTLDGQPVATPLSVLGVEGIQRTIGIVNSQVANGKNYVFDYWQHGGSATQTITTPINDVKYTAVYKETNSSSLTLEAENAALSGAQVFSSHPGYTGSGYADYINASADYVEWTFQAPQTGSYTIEFRYALGSGPRSLEVRANGAVVKSALSFPGTSSWASWAKVAVTVNLSAGTNKIRAIATGSSGPNIDHMVVTQNITFDPLTLEAENAALSGAQVFSSHAGYTGSGYADYINASGDFVEWTFQVPQTGSYTIEFRYAMGSDPRSLEVRANGAVVNPALSFPRTSSWSSWAKVPITANLTTGTNKIRATAIGSSGPNIDHIVVSQSMQLSSLANSEMGDTENAADILTVSPNPARKYVTLDVLAEEGEELNVSLVNMQGRVLSTHQFKGTVSGINSYTLHLNLSSGPYILRLVKENSTISKLILVEN